MCSLMLPSHCESAPRHVDVAILHGFFGITRPASVTAWIGSTMVAIAVRAIRSICLDFVLLKVHVAGVVRQSIFATDKS